MTDKRLAALPRLLAVAEVVSGVLFIVGFVTERQDSNLSWLWLTSGLFFLAYGARTAAMEVHQLGEVLRVVNAFSSHDIPLADIESISPEDTESGPLRLHVAGSKRPLRIDVTPRNRLEREALRRAITEAMRKSART